MIKLMEVKRAARHKGM